MMYIEYINKQKAIYVYEKCGFVRSKETMFEMKLMGGDAE